MVDGNVRPKHVAIYDLKPLFPEPPAPVDKK